MNPFLNSFFCFFVFDYYKQAVTTNVRPNPRGPFLSRYIKDPPWPWRIKDLSHSSTYVWYGTVLNRRWPVYENAPKVGTTKCVNSYIHSNCIMGRSVARINQWAAEWRCWRCWSKHCWSGKRQGRRRGVLFIRGHGESDQMKVKETRAWEWGSFMIT